MRFNICLSNNKYCITDCFGNDIRINGERLYFDTCEAAYAYICGFENSYDKTVEGYEWLARRNFKLIEEKNNIAKNIFEEYTVAFHAYDCNDKFTKKQVLDVLGKIVQPYINKEEPIYGKY